MADRFRELLTPGLVHFFDKTPSFPGRIARRRFPTGPASTPDQEHPGDHQGRPRKPHQVQGRAG
jgi:hypothetical protein